MPPRLRERANEPPVVPAFLLLMALLPPLAQACGACIEDKVAATYDYAVEAKAFARQQVLVFAQIDGPVDAKAAGAQIVAVAAKVRGAGRQ